jgi:hypothetical protein
VLKAYKGVRAWLLTLMTWVLGGVFDGLYSLTAFSLRKEPLVAIE